MKTKLLCVVVFALAAGTMLSQNNAIQGASVSKYEATVLKNNGNMFVVPIVASLSVTKNQPSDYVLTETVIIPDIRKQEGDANYMTRVTDYLNTKIEELKAQALFEFIDRENCSLIISPMYSTRTISSEGSKMTIEVKVKGYPAMYSKFRDMQPADSVLMNLNKLIEYQSPDVQKLTEQQMETNERTEEIKRN